MIVDAWRLAERTFETIQFAEFIFIEFSKINQPWHCQLQLIVRPVDANLIAS